MGRNSEGSDLKGGLRLGQKYLVQNSHLGMWGGTSAYKGAAYLQKVEDLRIWAPREFEFDIAFWGLTKHLGHFDIALQKLWYFGT